MSFRRIKRCNRKFTDSRYAYRQSRINSITEFSYNMGTSKNSSITVWWKNKKLIEQYIKSSQNLFIAEVTFFFQLLQCANDSINDKKSWLRLQSEDCKWYHMNKSEIEDDKIEIIRRKDERSRNHANSSEKLCLMTRIRCRQLIKDLIQENERSNQCLKQIE